MQVLLAMLCLLLHNAAGSDDVLRMPISQFTYEYEVLQKLWMLARDIDTLKNEKDVQGELNNILQTDLVSIKGRIKAADGSVYIRWGRSECPDKDTELVYKGYGGGSYYAHTGGAANDLCLPEEPEYEEGGYSDTCYSKAFVYGMEYQTRGGFLSNLHNNDVPCAVCRSNRPSMIMIPGRNSCYDSWTLEYAGYLVAGHYKYASASEYICLDKTAKAVVGGSANTEGRLLYIVEGQRGALKCPPYVHCREIFCAVCTK